MLICWLSAMCQIQIGQTIEGVQTEQELGYAVASSADGQTIVIGSRYAQINNLTVGSATVFNLVENQWQQVGSTLFGTVENGSFGSSVSISDDGSTIAIGASMDNSAAIAAGSVKVFTIDNGDWNQMGQVLTGTVAAEVFGISTDLSSSGLRLAVGLAGFGPAQGAVQVYDWDSVANQWVQIGNQLVGPAQNSFYGRNVALSSNGSIMAVGAPNADAGLVQVFEEANGSWTQIGQDLSGTSQGILFGWDVALSGDGTVMTVGVPFDNIGGTQSGSMQVFELNGANWVPKGSIISGNTPNQRLGNNVDISGDGQLVFTSSPFSNNFNNGQVTYYGFDGNEYNVLGSSLSLVSDSTGTTVSISNNGNTVIVGSSLFDVNGIIDSGRVQVYDISQTLSIERFNSLEIKVYPNPAYSKIHLETKGDNASLRTFVYDTSGSKVAIFEGNEYDLAKLASGTYILKIENDKSQITKKLVIK